MAIAANILLGIVALFHLWFFVLERFIWNMPLGQKIFRMSAERAEAGSLLAANQGVYNLVLALILIWTMVAKDAAQANPIKFALLIFIVIVGIYGGVTVGKNVFFMQVIPAVAALIVLTATVSAPKINDITTSFDAPPQFKVIATSQGGSDWTYHQEFALAQKTYYHGVLPLTLPMAPMQAFGLVDRALLAYPQWTIVQKDPANLRIEASATTQFLRFVDDVVIEIRPTGMGAEIHMRSRSRVGQSDFGVNARRVVDFLTRVNSLYRHGI